ncbi:MAG: glycosyltransferase family 39 protein [Fimbriimonas sp.]
MLRRVALGGPFGTWTFAPSQFFRPVVSLSLWAQYRLFGLDPLPFRVFNVGFHAAVAFLLYQFLREILPPRPHARMIAAVAGLLFVVHPSHAEPVQWIASRTDLVATFFGLLSLLFFVRYVNRPTRFGLVASGLAFLAGLLSKESVVVIPLLAGAYLLCARPASFRWPKPVIVFGTAFAAYLAARIALVGPLPDDGLVRSGGLKLAGSTLVQVLRCLLPGLPAGDPTLNNSEALRTIPGLAFIGVGILIFALLVWQARTPDVHPETSRAQRFLLAAFALSLLPALGLSVRLFRSQGERFLYLPSVFLLAWVVLVLLNRPARGGFRIVWLPTIAFVLLQWQNLFWREGAELSHRVSQSVTGDVALAGTRSPKRILFLNAPVRVHGSYAAFYVLGEIARDHGLPEDVQTEVVLAMQLKRLSHRVEVERAGPIVTLKISPEDGVFLPEDTFITQKPSPEALKAKGLMSLSAREARFDTRWLPAGTDVYLWTGERFQPLSPHP